MHCTALHWKMLPLLMWAVAWAPSARGDEPKPGTPRKPIIVSEEALRLHRDCLVFDGHNDLPWTLRKKAASSFDQADLSQPLEAFHTDIPRLRAGGLGAIFFAAYVPAETIAVRGAAHHALEEIDTIRRMVARYPETFALATSADDVVRIRRQGKIAALIGLEGGHAIENSPALLRMFYGLGVRYMTLTHSDTIDWADAATDDPRHGGLSDLGEEMVRTMNELGMLVDISHVSAETMRDVLRVTRAPVIASHSSAFAVAGHPRNVPDDVLELIRANRGVVMVNFYSGFVVPASARARAAMFDVRRRLKAQYPVEAEYQKAYDAWKAENPIEAGTIHDVLDHIEHIIRVAGVDHVGLGSDFDGIDLCPAQLTDVSMYPHITQGLLDRGYSPGDIRKVLGENSLRVLREAQTAAGKLRP